MKHYKIILIATLMSVALSGCYGPQNFDNSIQISRTGQYQIDIDSDFVNGGLMFFQAQSKQANKPIPPEELQKVYSSCEKEYNTIVNDDKKEKKLIISSKYLGECRFHAVLRFTGNVIKEKYVGTHIGKTTGFSDVGLNSQIQLSYNQKDKTITVVERVHGDKSSIEIFPNFKYNGKLSIKTDGRVISSNADSKPYWGLFGAYKWNIDDFETPDVKFVISTVGI